MTRAAFGWGSLLALALGGWLLLAGVARAADEGEKKEDGESKPEEEPKTEEPVPVETKAKAKEFKLEEPKREKSFKQKSVYGPIQRRVYDLEHELELGWAYLPLDPYYKGYGVQIAYTIHLNHILALELFRVGFSYNVDTDLKTKLIEQMPDISPGDFPAVVLFENTNLVLKLLYGKHSFLNGTVLHFEIFATAGGALIYRNPYNLFDFDFTTNRFEFGVNAGFGFRIWLNPDWSVRVDLRDTVILLDFFSGDIPLENSALVGLSFAVNL
jgi:outer membrane beta-barrel protein